MLAWHERYGRLPSSYDWSSTHASRRGAHALERLNAGEWPPTATVTELFGSWKTAKTAAREAISHR